ncbi:MAG: DUF4935 domain-containing protein [Acidobacteria bacterium]|nr:DUF4935 domain-containing protein [Acidobacteriota bacterium]
MIVYVETNFLLELAYLQEGCDSCKALVALGNSGKITLALPAVCAAEARTTWARRRSDRREFHTALQKHIREISRSKPLRGLIEQSRDLSRALLDSDEDSRRRLEEAIDAVAACGRVIPLSQQILEMARWHELAFRLSPQDAVVLASVRADAETQGGPKVFVSQDAKGFAFPKVYAELGAVQCKVLVNFSDALARVKNSIETSIDG